ncbi:hypothetical protein B6U80_00805 [Candidatus Pacearchaeota archaeon ex4484_26]|nr:MAG: hypothetical protein B6U80_00805 [Candidatus Pacearchaeota archaeon ex4484_26]
MRKKSKRNPSIYFLLIALIVLIADRITKHLALQGNYLKNYGLLFGTFDIPGLRWVFVILVILVLVFLIYVLSMKDIKKNPLFQLGLLLMIAGLIGNVIDRIFYGFIIDFINIRVSAFNLADASITAGALLIIFKLIRKER